MTESQSSTPSALALREIPRPYLSLYQQAAQRYGLDWAVIAAIGKVECDHGRDSDRSCTREGAVNSAGAGGPMQFIASTWARYGVDGDADGRVDRWDPADATGPALPAGAGPRTTRATGPTVLAPAPERDRPEGHARQHQHDQDDDHRSRQERPA